MQNVKSKAACSDFLKSFFYFAFIFPSDTENFFGALFLEEVRICEMFFDFSLESEFHKFRGILWRLTLNESVCQTYFFVYNLTRSENSC